jgi:hypothetical protein
MLALSLLCWAGQPIVLFAPATDVKLGLSEAEADVETAFWADVRGEALWDFLTLWTLVVASVLLIIDHGSWAYFGLVGGGMYVCFAGRGISTRTAMRRRHSGQRRRGTLRRGDLYGPRRGQSVH